LFFDPPPEIVTDAAEDAGDAVATKRDGDAGNPDREEELSLRPVPASQHFRGFSLS
jgi:hypothetical protein